MATIKRDHAILVNKLLKKHGDVSIPFLQRKLKINFSMAELIKKTIKYRVR